MIDATESAASTPRRRRIDPALLLFGLGLAALAGGGAWLYRHPDLLTPNPTADAAPPFDARMMLLERRVGRLEAATDGSTGTGAAHMAQQAIEARLSALEHARADPSGEAAATPPDARTAPAPDQVSEARVAALADQVRAMQAALAAKTGTLDRQIAVMRRMTAMQETAIELAAGRRLDRLSDLPDTPEALRRFVDEAPPTEAGLRAGFVGAAGAARAADDSGGASFAGRLRRAAGRLVTIRRGDAVVLGDAADEPLRRAEERLNAGDPAGAVAALAPLQGAAAEAMAGWRGQAEALAAARGALAALPTRSSDPTPVGMPADSPAP